MLVSFTTTEADWSNETSAAGDSGGSSTSTSSATSFLASSASSPTSPPTAAAALPDDEYPVGSLIDVVFPFAAPDSNEFGQTIRISRVIWKGMIGDRLAIRVHPGKEDELAEDFVGLPSMEHDMYLFVHGENAPDRHLVGPPQTMKYSESPTLIRMRRRDKDFFLPKLKEIVNLEICESDGNCFYRSAAHQVHVSTIVLLLGRWRLTNMYSTFYCYLLVVCSIGAIKIGTVKCDDWFLSFSSLKKGGKYLQRIFRRTIRLWKTTSLIEGETASMVASLSTGFSRKCFKSMSTFRSWAASLVAKSLTVHTTPMIATSILQSRRIDINLYAP